MTIVFDLDGTLLNTIDDLGYACNHALGENGFPTHPIEAYPRMVGNGINNLIRRALPSVGQTEENVLRVRECLIPYYNAHNCDFTRPYEGIPEVLQMLKSQGHLLAVASNKYQAATEKIVEHFFRVSLMSSSANAKAFHANPIHKSSRISSLNSQH